LAFVIATRGGDGAAPTTITTTAPGATTVSSTDGATATTPTEPTLSDAITAVGTRYEFTAVVTVGGVEASHVEGAVFDGTGQYLVTSRDTTVEYIVGPAGQWARTGAGPWAVLGGPAPVADPLTPLSHPTTVTVVSSDGGDSMLDAIYPASELGFAGTDEVAVTITIVDGVLAEIRYAVAVGVDQGLVVTTIHAVPDMTPITTP
jgi:hypothetical protein